MKKLSKNKFAKLFATFLGASTILTPIATLVSCEQINKTPIEKQNSNSNNNEGGQPGTGGGEQQPGTGGGEQQPGTGGETWQETTLPDGTIQKSITFAENKIIVKEKDKQYSLEGNIYIGDVSTLETKLNELTELNDKKIDTSALNINCFVKQEGAKPQSAITTREVSPVTPPTYLSTKITPSILQDVLKLKENRKFSTLTLNNQTSNGPIDIEFDSSKEDFFDIKDLNKFSFSNNFKLKINSKIILGSKAKKITGPLNHDLTPYPKVGELLTLLQNSKLKSYITVKDVYITGNVKDLLPLLVGPNSIKEVNGGVKFLNHTKFSCDEINLTEYKGEENNTVPIALEQFLEFRKRTDEVYNTVLKIKTKPLYLANLVLENIDTTQLDENKLKFLHFNGDSVGGKVIFKNSNLSKMQYRGTTGPVSVTFDNTILPTDMISSGVNTLILKNVAFPKEEFNSNPEY